MSRYRILLADDDQELAQLLRDLLTRDGFDVVLAHDADTAIAAARNETFDALVLLTPMRAADGAASKPKACTGSWWRSRPECWVRSIQAHWSA